MSGKWTPGPWAWFGNAGGCPDIYLATTHSGRRYVMSFRRWGMRGAQPQFQRDHVLVDASELLQFEVGNKSVVGIEAAKNDESVYRYQISGIASPDARLIAAAPELAEALEAMVERFRHNIFTMTQGDRELLTRAAAALAKAKGEA